jgi:hyperosmotically inducible protein
MKRSSLVGAALVLVVCVSAESHRSLSQYAPLNASRVSTFGENRTEREVQRSLQNLPDFGVFDHLAYTVNGNTVLLYGKVLKPDLKDAAAAAAATAQGVARVINHITLLPDSPSDNRIRIAVFGAIYGDPLLGRYAFAGSGAIHIVVEGGRVTLEGEVALASEARRIVERVERVSHVSSISNHLAVGN